jgi:hypothetical protein
LKTILQIVPRLPGGIDGVGDYALNLAAKLRDDYATETIFGVPGLYGASDARGFEAFPLEQLTRANSARFSDTILHYVNYGYQKRGVPFGLLSVLAELRRHNRGRLVTVFHELYASGPPWTSAFWLRPLQRRIARSIARLADSCIVSSESMRVQLRQVAGEVAVSIHPVVSNFGEPVLQRPEITNRDPQRWVICGGNALIERSLQSFRAILSRIPASYAPRRLFLIGGRESSAVRALIVDLADIEIDYHPEIGVSDASQILGRCCFAWMDYFRHQGVPTEVILKSSAFAAMCAHGVIPIFPERGLEISVGGERLPGPFFVGEKISELPATDDRAAIAAKFYDWYHNHASSEHLAHGIAAAVGLNVLS